MQIEQSRELQEIDDLLRSSISEVPAAYRQAIEDVLTRARIKESPEWSVVLLPLLACQAADGEVGVAIPVAAAWRALHIAADMLDDVQDDLLAQRIPPSHAVFTNIATGLIIVCQRILDTLPAKMKRLVLPRFNDTVLYMASGQHLDLCCRNTLTLADYEFVMRAKSGAFFSLALSAGALVGGAKDLAVFETIGMSLGMLIQVSDDDMGLRRPIRESDLGMGAFSLPVIYGLAVLPPAEATRLRALVNRSAWDHESAHSARQILLDAGCDHFMLTQMLTYHRQMQEGVYRLGTSANTRGLIGWINKLLGKLQLPPLYNAV